MNKEAIDSDCEKAIAAWEKQLTKEGRHMGWHFTGEYKTWEREKVAFRAGWNAAKKSKSKKTKKG